MPRSAQRSGRPTGLAALVGADVEARAVGGSCYRGRLVRLADGFLEIERGTNARTIFVSTGHLVALMDESAPRLHEVGRRDAEAAFDSEEV